jgi:glycosyltransferase involved in cell wall biosynthesis
MKILYDHQIFTLQKYGGISRYFTQLIKKISAYEKVEVAVKYSDNLYLKDSNLIEKLEEIFEPYVPIDKFLGGLRFRGKRRLFRLTKNYSEEEFIDSYLINKQLSIELLKKQDFDVFHPTYYDDYFLEYLGNKPFVLTIHDMIHELYPEMLYDFEISGRKRDLAKKADHIIAVSENTKKDIIEILGIPEEKISVVYHANSLEENINIKLDIPENFILFVGDRNYYKNFLFFVRAVEPLLKEENSLKILCTGRNFSENELVYFKNLDLLSSFIYQSVNDDELFQLYRHAKALVFSSYYEGFGLPIIEAFEAGCPVLLSNTSCFPEIAKDAAVYFDPKSIKEIRNLIHEIINNKLLRNNLIKKGLERVKDFTWENSAQQTLEIYKNILNSV